MGKGMRQIEENNPVRLVFLGCGFATEIHSKTLSSFNGVRRFYASRDGSKAKYYNEKFDGEGYWGSYDEAIHSPDVDEVPV